MDIFDCMRNRRSITKYLDLPLEFDKICTVIEAGTRAPSSGNIQNWRFVLVSGKEKMQKIAELSANQMWIANAPVAIIVCMDNQRMEAFYNQRGVDIYSLENGAACMQNMCLAATAMELGSCWVGAFDEMRVKQIFEIPGHVQPIGILTIGYPDEKLEEKPRITVDKLVFLNNYGNRYTDLHLHFRDYFVEWEKQTAEAQDAIKRMSKRSSTFFNELSEKMKRDSAKPSARESLEAAKHRGSEVTGTFVEWLQKTLFRSPGEQSAATQEQRQPQAPPPPSGAVQETGTHHSHSTSGKDYYDQVHDGARSQNEQQ